MPDGPVDGTAVTDSFALSDGATLHVVCHDQPDAEATVIFSHAYACDHRYWRRMVEVLATAAGRPVRLLVYDHRGHGDSSRATRRTASVGWLAGDLAELVERRTVGPVLLVGHGMGGLTVLNLAARHEGLFQDRVAGIVLMATATGWPVETSAALTGKLVAELEVILGSGLVRRVRQRIDKAMTAGLRWLLFGEDPRAEDVRLVAEMLDRHWPHTAALFRPDLADHDRRKALEVVANTPVLGIVGQRDRMVSPAHGRAFARAAPRGESMVLPALGHMLPLEGASAITPRIVAMLRDALLRG
jgi:pimeloyl-ACP methyl ester carboxylesterase